MNFKRVPLLASLHLKDAGALTASGASALARLTSQSVSFDGVWDAPYPGPASDLLGLARLPSLRKLYVSAAREEGRDEFLAALPLSSASRLTHLDFSFFSRGAREVSDGCAAIISHITPLRGLRELQLGYPSAAQLTAEHVDILGDMIGLHSLEFVFLKQMPRGEPRRRRMQVRAAVHLCNSSSRSACMPSCHILC